MASKHQIIDILSRASKKIASAQSPENDQEVDDDDEEYVNVGIGGVLAATEKLLAVNRGLEPADMRDSWRFKKVYSPAALLKERIKLDADKVRYNIMRRVSKDKSLRSLHIAAFDPYARGLIIGNSLSQPLEEINPLQLVEAANSVTGMGPGGIGSEDAITEDAQNVTPSQFGFISPLEGPESSRAGIDTRRAWGSKLGSDGRIYQRFYDRRRKKFAWLNPDQVADFTVKLPD
jgi:DNA-directed RNA polymerase beta subunit